jgi:hypothetical protein
MKTKLFKIAIIAIAMAGCGKEDSTGGAADADTPRLTVTPAVITAGSATGNYSVSITGNMDWTAVSGAEAWCTVFPPAGSAAATVTVTVTGAGTLTRTAAVTIAAGTLTLPVTVTQAPRPAPAPDFPDLAHAASNKTWQFANRTWSDVIHISACATSTFDSSDTEPRCRNYTVPTGDTTYYYYNWAYVNAHKNEMCPAPWRVPTREEFKVLAPSTLATLRNAWGWGGRARGAAIELENNAWLWAATPAPDYKASAWMFHYRPAAGDQTSAVAYDYAPVSYGFPVRCVHD